MNNIYEKEEILGISSRTKGFIKLKERMLNVSMYVVLYTALNEEDSFYIYRPADAKKSSFVDPQTSQSDFPPNALLY